MLYVAFFAVYHPYATSEKKLRDDFAFLVLIPPLAHFPHFADMGQHKGRLVL